MEIKKFYTPKELAAVEGVSQWAVYGWLREGKLPHRRRGVAGRIVIDYNDYINWTRECARPAVM